MEVEVPTDEELFRRMSSQGNIQAHKKRSPEEVKELLETMGLNEGEIRPLVQTLYSRAPLEKPVGDFRMLELDEHLLECLNTPGASLSFRGDAKEPAVLCSDTRTYEVKEAETSDTCLLVANLNCGEEANLEGDEIIIKEREVVGMYNTYLEVRECSPKVSKLLAVLGPSSFKGVEYESLLERETLYDWERIRREIQASDGEIRAIMPEYLIVEMNGFYRLVSFEFEARALPLMLEVVEENSWALDEVDKEVTFDSLEELIPKNIFDLLFHKYAEKSGKKNEDGIELYKYDEVKSCRLMAQILLNTFPTNSYNDFMDAWRMGCPEGMTPKEEYLYGVAVVTINSQNMRKEVKLFPEANLPDNLMKRLNELFRVKEKWTIREITPYIAKFATRNQSVNAILTKYARPSTTNGVRYYSSKHGK